MTRTRWWMVTAVAVGVTGALLAMQAPFLRWQFVERWTVVPLASSIAAMSALAVGQLLAARKLGISAASRSRALLATAVLIPAMSVAAVGAMRSDVRWWLLQDVLRWIAWAGCLGFMAVLASAGARRWGAWVLPGAAMLTLVTVGLAAFASDAGFWFGMAGGTAGLVASLAASVAALLSKEPRRRHGPVLGVVLTGAAIALLGLGGWTLRRDLADLSYRNARATPSPGWILGTGSTPGLTNHEVMFLVHVPTGRHFRLGAEHFHGCMVQAPPTGFSADGRWMAWAKASPGVDDELRILALRDGPLEDRPLHCMSGGHDAGLLLSPAGRRLLVEGERRLTVVDVDRDVIVGELALPADARVSATRIDDSGRVTLVMDDLESAYVLTHAGGTMERRPLVPPAIATGDPMQLADARFLAGERIALGCIGAHEDNRIEVRRLDDGAVVLARTAPVFTVQRIADLADGGLAFATAGGGVEILGPDGDLQRTCEVGGRLSYEQLLGEHAPGLLVMEACRDGRSHVLALDVESCALVAWFEDRINIGRPGQGIGHPGTCMFQEALGCRGRVSGAALHEVDWRRGTDRVVWQDSYSSR